MMAGFPKSFLAGFLAKRKVSCFLGAESHREFRKLSTKPLDSSGCQRFPVYETVSTGGNQEFPDGFLKGFLLAEQRCR